MKEYYKKKELCKIIKISRRTLDRWINEEKIPYYKFGNGVRFDSIKITHWFESKKGGQNTRNRCD